jgi:uncharacterized protein (DUF302 family)
MMTAYEVQHIEHTSRRAFEDVVAAFEAATGDIQDRAFADALAASKDQQDFEDRIRGHEGSSGFMRFLMLDHGAWLALYGEHAKCRLYTLGNPLIARTMLKHDLRVGLNVPVRLIIYETAAGEARVAYDQPSSLMSHLDNPEVAAAATKLDSKLYALAEQAVRASSSEAAAA